MTHTGLGFAGRRRRDGGHEDDVDERREEAAQRAPLDRHRHHAVHREDDEHVVPDHDVSVQLQPALLRSQSVEDTACQR